MAFHTKMKLTYFCLLIFLILLCSSSILVTSLDSCASNLVQLQQPIPFDTKSLLCIPVWGDHNFILRYAKASSNIWSFIFSFPTNINAYGAIGFSKNGNMVGSTAIVGWMPSSGAGGMKMYALDGKSTNEVILDKGELYIMNASSIAAAGTSLVYMIFQLKTTQPSTKLLFAIGPNGVFPNYPDYALSKHSGHISLVIDYSKGKIIKRNCNPNVPRRRHGILQSAGWTTLMILGSIIYRYFKQRDPAWFYLHASIQTIYFLAGIISLRLYVIELLVIFIDFFFF